MAASHVMEVISPIFFVLFCTFSVQSAYPTATPPPPVENSTTYRLNEVLRGAKTLERFTVSHYNHYHHHHYTMSKMKMRPLLYSQDTSNDSGAHVEINEVTL